MNMNMIPAIVEHIPIVTIPSDMGPHNMIVSSQTQPTSNPSLTGNLLRVRLSCHFIVLLRFFSRPPAVNGFGPEYNRAVVLRNGILRSYPTIEITL